MMASARRVAPLKLRKGDELASWEEFIFRFEAAALGERWGERGGKGGKGKGKGLKDESGGGGTDAGGNTSESLDEVTEEDRIKGAALFTAVGEEGQAIAMRWGLKLEALSFNDLVRRFETRFGVCESIPLSRHRFLCMKQGEEESVTGFIERLKGAANKCRLGGEYDSWVAQVIAKGVRREELRRRLLELPEFNLTEVEAACQRSEAADTTEREMSGSERVEVAAVGEEVARVGMAMGGGDRNRVLKCFTCGKEGHLVRECAMSKCFRCGGMGHIAPMCSGNRPIGGGRGSFAAGRGGFTTGRGGYRGGGRDGVRGVGSGRWEGDQVGEVSDRRI